MLPKFIKVFPHEYKRVLGVPRTPFTLEPDKHGPSADTLAGISTTALKDAAASAREAMRG